MKILIIGLGGIGSILSNTISRFLNTKNYETKILLIDGDTYENKNVERQEFNGFGNKADVKTRELRSKFNKIIFENHPIYLDENYCNQLLTENSIVFLCVDNHKTRKVVSDFCKNLNNIILISGGNELTDGNVQIYIRKGGKDVTPSLTDYHPEIETPTDKSPDEMSCEELSQSAPQLYFTNFMVAGHMCSAFYNIIERSNATISEVYFDILTMNSKSNFRFPKQ